MYIVFTSTRVFQGYVKTALKPHVKNKTWTLHDLKNYFKVSFKFSLLVLNFVQSTRTWFNLDIHVRVCTSCRISFKMVHC